MPEFLRDVRHQWVKQPEYRREDKVDDAQAIHAPALLTL
jgi:hypothetical protein